MKTTQGRCPLCGEEAKLIDSHIFPEFFYTELYGSKDERAVSLSDHPRHKPQARQKGYTERLLCSPCDNGLSAYEAYAARLLREMDEAFEKTPASIEMHSVDFAKLRIFGLSLLWRAHHAKSHGFGQVRLGPHAAVIREMLRTENAGEPSDYPFMITRVAGFPLNPHTMTTPMAKRINGTRAYLFMARGYDWLFLMSTAAERLASFPGVGSGPTLVVPAVAVDRWSVIRRAINRMR